MGEVERRLGSDNLPLEGTCSGVLAAGADMDVMESPAMMVAAGADQGGAGCDGMLSCHSDGLEIPGAS